MGAMPAPEVAGTVWATGSAGREEPLDLAREEPFPEPFPDPDQELVLELAADPGPASGPPAVLAAGLRSVSESSGVPSERLPGGAVTPLLASR